MKLCSIQIFDILTQDETHCHVNCKNLDPGIGYAHGRGWCKAFEGTNLRRDKIGYLRCSDCVLKGVLPKDVKKIIRAALDAGKEEKG